MEGCERRWLTPGALEFKLVGVASGGVSSGDRYRRLHGVDVILAARNLDLVIRGERGRMTRCRLDAAALEGAYDWLDRYRRYWEASLERLAENVENAS